MTHLPRNLLATLGAAAMMASTGVDAAIVTSGLTSNWDTGKTSTTWISTAPASGTASWTIGSGATLNAAPVTGTNIDSSYGFSPGNGVGTMASVTPFSSQGADFTIELWLRPSGLANGKQVIFETGGHSSGMALTLWGDTLIYALKTGNSTDVDPDFQLSYTLTAGDITDFVQVVLASTGTVTSLYVNPISSASPDIAKANSGYVDYFGADGAGIGGRSGTMGAGSSSGSSNWESIDFTNFDGEIGIVRVYNGALTGSEVSQNFYTVIPEPATGILAALGLAALFRRPFRRRSI